MNRVVWVDALKGILIVLVVLGHSIQTVMIKMGLSFIDDYLWNLIYSFHMPAFIAVSGYLAYSKKLVVGDGFWIKTSVKRFRQLMVPYLLWSIMLFLVNHNVLHYHEYLLYPQKSLWFLWALFFIVIIFNAVDGIAHKLNLMQEVAMGGSWIILIGVMFALPDAKLLGVEYIAYYFFFYLAGYYLNKHSGKLIIKNGFMLALIGVVWFCLGSIYTTQGLPQELTCVPLVPSSILYYIYRISTSLFAIWFFFSIAIKVFECNRRQSSWIVKLGRVSLGIYAVHMVIRFRLVDVLVAMMSNLKYAPFLLLTFAIMLPVSYLLVWIIGSNKWTAELLLRKLRY